jgi:hypothetical protein
MLSSSWIVTGSDGVPLQPGIQVDAFAPICSLPSSWAIPTRVLVNDFVTE